MSDNKQKNVVKSVEYLADRDPIPKQFATVEEMAEFWDTHDTADYEDSFGEPVELELNLAHPRQRAKYIALEGDLAERLAQHAQQRGLSAETLINLWVQEKLALNG